MKRFFIAYITTAICLSVNAQVGAFSRVTIKDSAKLTDTWLTGIGKVMGGPDSVSQTKVPTMKAVWDALRGISVGSGLETDPSVPGHVKGITLADLVNWNREDTITNIQATNDSTLVITTNNRTWTVVIKGKAGSGGAESDPSVPAHVKSITLLDIANWNREDTITNAIALTDSTFRITTNNRQWNLTIKGKAETDPSVPAHVKAIGLPDIANWNREDSIINAVALNDTVIRITTNNRFWDVPIKGRPATAGNFFKDTTLNGANTVGDPTRINPNYIKTIAQDSNTVDASRFGLTMLSLDNSAAVQAAIDFANAKGKKTVYIPPGNYNFTKSFWIKYDNITLINEGNLYLRNGGEADPYPAERCLILVGKPATSYGAASVRIKNPTIINRGIIDASQLNLTLNPATQFPQPNAANQWLQVGVVQVYAADNCNLYGLKIIQAPHSAVRILDPIGGGLYNTELIGLRNTQSGPNFMVDGNSVNILSTGDAPDSLKLGRFNIDNIYVKGYINDQWPVSLVTGTAVPLNSANIGINIQTSGFGTTRSSLTGINVTNAHVEQSIYGIQAENQSTDSSDFAVHINNVFAYRTVYAIGVSGNTVNLNNAKWATIKNVFAYETIGDVIHCNLNDVEIDGVFAKNWGVGVLNNPFSDLFTSNRNISYVVKVVPSQQNALIPFEAKNISIKNVIGSNDFVSNTTRHNSIGGVAVVANTDNQIINSVDISHIKIFGNKATKVHADPKKNSGIVLGGKFRNVSINDNFITGMPSNAIFIGGPDDNPGNPLSTSSIVSISNNKFENNGYGNTFPQQHIHVIGNGRNYSILGNNSNETDGARVAHMLYWENGSTADSVFISNNVYKGITQPAAAFNITSLTSAIAIKIDDYFFAAKTVSDTNSYKPIVQANNGDKARLDRWPGGNNASTNLGKTTTAIDITITNSNGTGVAIPAANDVAAGLLTASKSKKLDDIDTTGLYIQAGTNMAISGIGTQANPVVFNATGIGGSQSFEDALNVSPNLTATKTITNSPGTYLNIDSLKVNGVNIKKAFKNWSGNYGDSLIMQAFILRPSWTTTNNGDAVTWNVLTSTDGHNFTYFGQAVNDGTRIRIDYPEVREVLTHQVGADDYLSAKGVKAGGSIGVQSAYIQLSAPMNGYGSGPAQGTGTGWSGRPGLTWASGVTTWTMPSTQVVHVDDPWGVSAHYLDLTDTKNYRLEFLTSGLGVNEVKMQLRDNITNTVITSAPTTTDRLVLHAPTAYSVFDATQFQGNDILRNVLGPVSPSGAALFFFAVFKSK